MAQEISHSWYLYGNGNAVIIYDTEFIGGQYVKGNLILLGSIFENKVTEMVMGERNSEGISSFSKPWNFNNFLINIIIYYHFLI